MIGSRIRRYRKGAGLTLTELAERAGVAKSYLSTLERDQNTNPSVELVAKISSELDVPVNELVPELIEPEVAQFDNSDYAWWNLIQELRESGITLKELQEFVEFHKWKKQVRGDEPSSP
ncbi:helix-turn-helix domain-containing protein [Evansella tamaricis]|uniref:Helix-turn-helix domain-containing protein n=1 Tax=Evansella tamaricis TaxID=2069301 RepID=A0ABS6JGE0_9BACI|nr:helix-turn-helix transcriptional regulator [Evansella tamaricis]MBU9712735.1 helix-turn-helix domain-containing protein [Evansella tamaricis]